MNSYERVMTALNREEPDRVPTFEWLIDQAVISGMHGEECTLLDFVEKADIDGIAVAAVNKTETIGDNHFIDEWGIEKKSVYTDPLPVAIRGPIADEKDLKGLSIPGSENLSLITQALITMKAIKSAKSVAFATNEIPSPSRNNEAITKTARVAAHGVLFFLCTLDNTSGSDVWSAIP